MKFDIGVKIENAQGFFHRSKIITITPRFFLSNESSHALAIA